MSANQSTVNGGYAKEFYVFEETVGLHMKQIIETVELYKEANRAMANIAEQ